MDTMMIYATHIILHIALCWICPWQMSMLSVLLFAFAAAIAIRHIDKGTTTKTVKATAVSFAWIFLIHYIPILFLGMHRVAAFQFVGVIVMFTMYLGCNNAKEKLGINANNALMHVGLIINNLIAHFMVSGGTGAGPY
jgi:hypothetical protein